MTTLSLAPGQFVVDLDDKASLRATLAKIQAMVDSGEMTELRRKWDYYFLVEFGQLNENEFSPHSYEESDQYGEPQDHLAFYDAILKHKDLHEELAAYIREQNDFYWDLFSGDSCRDFMGAYVLYHLTQTDTAYIPLYLDWARRIHPQQASDLVEKWSRPIIETHGLTEETLPIVVWRITTQSMPREDDKDLELFIQWCNTEYNLDDYLGTDEGKKAFRNAAEIERREHTTRNWYSLLYEKETWEVYPNLWACLVDTKNNPLAWAQWRDIVGSGLQNLEQFTRWQEIDVNRDIIIDDQWISPLDMAVECNNVEAIPYLAQHGATISNAKTGCPALLKAAEQEGLEMINALLDAGADLDAKHGATGSTVLAAAMSELHATADGIKAIIDLGADINAPSFAEDVSPLSVLLADGSWHSPPLDLVEFIVNKGATLDATDSRYHERTPLHMAAAKGMHEVTTFLLEQGADKGCVDANGNTALDIAKTANDEQMIQIIESTSTSDIPEIYTQVKQALVDRKIPETGLDEAFAYALKSGQKNALFNELLEAYLPLLAKAERHNDILAACLNGIEAGVQINDSGWDSNLKFMLNAYEAAGRWEEGRSVLLKQMVHTQGSSEFDAFITIEMEKDPSIAKMVALIYKDIIYGTNISLCQEEKALIDDTSIQAADRKAYIGDHEIALPSIEDCHPTFCFFTGKDALKAGDDKNPFIDRAFDVALDSARNENYLANLVDMLNLYTPIKHSKQEWDAIIDKCSLILEFSESLTAETFIQLMDAYSELERWQAWHDTWLRRLYRYQNAAPFAKAIECELAHGDKATAKMLAEACHYMPLVDKKAQRRRKREGKEFVLPEVAETLLNDDSIVSTSNATFITNKSLANEVDVRFEQERQAWAKYLKEEANDENPVEHYLETTDKFLDVSLTLLDGVVPTLCDALFEYIKDSANELGENKVGCIEFDYSDYEEGAFHMQALLYQTCHSFGGVFNNIHIPEEKVVRFLKDIGNIPKDKEEYVREEVQPLNIRAFYILQRVAQRFTTLDHSRLPLADEVSFIIKDGGNGTVNGLLYVLQR